MAREWIALERHEGRAHDLSLYARALHAQLHRWVDGDGHIPARLEGDLCEAMARSIAFRFGATRGDRRLISGHLRELVEAGAQLGHTGATRAAAATASTRIACCAINPGLADASLGRSAARYASGMSATLASTCPGQQPSRAAICASTGNSIRNAPESGRAS